MSKLATTLKEEITRLGRKEARRIALPLKRRVLSLERLVREQRASFKQLARQAAVAISRASRPTAAAGGDEGDRARLTPRNIKGLRKKLRLSQAQFAKLAGVTPVAVYFWESGRTKPRGRTRAAIIGLRGIGVREATRRLDDDSANPPVPTRSRKGRRKRAKARRVPRRSTATPRRKPPRGRRARA
jgi:DNA-binding transcriptional regulator YiaG